MTQEQLKEIQSKLNNAKYEIKMLTQQFESAMDDDIEIHDEAHHYLTIAEFALDDFQEIFNHIKQNEQ